MGEIRWLSVVAGRHSSQWMFAVRSKFWLDSQRAECQDRGFRGAWTDFT
jgi:hypothetical protein